VRVSRRVRRLAVEEARFTAQDGLPPMRKSPSVTQKFCLRRGDELVRYRRARFHGAMLPRIGVSDVAPLARG